VPTGVRHRPLVVALTGGIASGKSEAARAFAALGVPVIDTDRIARELVRPGSEALKEIRAAFGDAVLGPDGGLDRRALRARIFADPAARERLEAILHPRIRRAVEERLARIRAPYCVVVVPLLVEAGWTDLADRVLVVDVPEKVQIRRLTGRDGIDAAAARAILAAQSGRARRLAAATEIVDNTGDRRALHTRIRSLDRLYRQAAGAGA